jgi:hypothetical protein
LHKEIAMSYYTRQSLLVAPAQKWDEDAHPRVPAGAPDGGQFTSGGGGGGGARHVPISYGKGRYGVERLEETGGKGQRATGRVPEEFASMEEAREHAEVLDAPVRHHPVSYGKHSYGVERVAEVPEKGNRAVGRVPEEFGSMEEARAHAAALDKPKKPAPETIRAKYRAAQAEAAWGKGKRSDEGRAPLKGHPYHDKTDEELRYIQRDAGEAARAMGRDRPQQEGKYLDQMNNAATVLYHRRQLGKR